MKQALGIRLILLVGFLIPSFAGEALAGNRVPIKGRFTGSVRVVPLDAGPSRFRVEYSAAGILSHMGRVTANLVTPDVGVDVDNRQLLAVSNQWTGTITAANGDKIFGSYIFTDPSISVSPRGDLTTHADLNVTGGTGRFRSATGRAVAVARANIFDMTFRIELKGWISSVGSSKR